MDYLKDDETDIEPAAESGDVQTKFSFRGVPLDAFSTMHRQADLRLSYDGTMSAAEDAQNLIFMLMASSRNAKNWKHEIDSIRGDGCAKFRIRAAEWAEVNIREEKDWKEALAVVRKIKGIADKADEVQVEPSKSGEAPGNG